MTDDLSPLGEVNLPSSEDALAAEVRRTHPEARIEVLEVTTNGARKLRYKVYYGPRPLSDWRASARAAWAAALARVRKEGIDNG